jgi:hypothetical protein
MFATRLVDVDPAKLSVGQPMEVQFEDVESTGVTLPLVRPPRP